MKRFKNFSSGLITFLIVYFIFFTMDDLVAQLIFYFGLSIIGKYIFRLTKVIINKLTGDSDEQRRNSIRDWEDKTTLSRYGKILEEYSERWNPEPLPHLNKNSENLELDTLRVSIGTMYMNIVYGRDKTPFVVFKELLWKLTYTVLY